MRPLSPATGSRGAVLITALVLLVIFTLLATVSMRQAGLSEKASANALQRQTVFQIAESAVNTVLNDEANFEYLATDASGGCQPVSLTTDLQTSLAGLPYSLDGDARVCQVGLKNIADSSEGFVFGVFDVVGTGTLIEGGGNTVGQAVVNQGFELRLLSDSEVLYETGGD